MRGKIFSVSILFLLLGALTLQNVAPAFAAPPTFNQIRRVIQQHVRFRTYQSTLADKIESRFKAHKVHIENLMARIESRIQKMKSAGKDMTAAENELAIAKNDLEIAGASQSSTIQKLHDLSSQNGKLNTDQRAEVKTNILNTQKSYIQVVKDLQLTINAMKMAK